MEFKDRSDIKCPNCGAELDEHNEHSLVSGGAFVDGLFDFKCHKCGKNIQIEFIPSFYVGRIMDGGQASDHFTLEQLKKIEELNSSMIRILQQDQFRSTLSGQARYYETLDKLRQAKYDRMKHYAESSRSLDYESKWLKKAKEIEVEIEFLEEDLKKRLADPETKKNVDSIEKMLEEKNRIRLSIKPVCKP